MVLFTTSLTNQIQAASSGITQYPSISSLASRRVIGDSFEREALTPTGYTTIYTLASNDGNGSVDLAITPGRCRLTCDSSAIGDDADLRMSGLVFQRVGRILDADGTPLLTSQIIFESQFTPAGTVTDSEGFIGFMGNSLAALTGLPTTAVHMGVFWDRSASTNYFLTSADGTTQSTTNTGQAVDNTTGIIIRIIWNGDNTATVSLLLATTGATISSQTVTALNSNQHMSPHWFVQTEAAAAKTVGILDWSAVRF